MLNELYKLSSSLKKCGITIGTQHQDVKKPGKGDGLIIEVDRQGQPANVEFADSIKMTKLWTIRKGKHNSFPHMKLKPLWNSALDDPVRDELEHRVAARVGLEVAVVTGV